MLSTSFFKVLILMMAVIGSLGYQYIIPGEMGKSQDHEGFCFYSDTKTLIKKGESKILPSCEEVFCGSDYTMTILGCGTFSLQDPSCKKWKRDYSKPYPDCCNTFICVERVKSKVQFVDENKL